MFLHDPYQFCKVLVWSGRPEGFDFNTISELVSKSVSYQGRPRAARAAKKRLRVDGENLVPVPFFVCLILFL